MGQKLRIAYIHGRLGPHLMHGRLAKSVRSKFFLVDAFKRWNDGNYSKLYLIYAWIYNAFAFEGLKKFDAFLVSGPHISPLIMKLFRLKKEQKIIAHLGDETMYFLFSGWYNRLTEKLLKWALNQYDVLLCEGKMAADLAKLNGIRKPKIYTTYLGIPKERQSQLSDIKPDLNANHLVFISTGPGGWRTYYKGLDLMIEVFNSLHPQKADLQFTIIGEWDKAVQEQLLSKCEDSSRNAIQFVGQTNEIGQYLEKGSIYFHIARGDAFPTVVLEAMCAGLIPIVSEWTGSKEIVHEIDSDLITSLAHEDIKAKLKKLIELDFDKRQAYSQRARKLAMDFSEEFALEHYQKTFDKIERELF